MTVMAPDQPGVVERLATLVAKHEGNWEESRMSRLAGQFAGILKIQISQARREAFRQSLSELESEGILVHLTDDQSDDIPGESALTHVRRITKVSCARCPRYF